MIREEVKMLVAEYSELTKNVSDKIDQINSKRESIGVKILDGNRAEDLMLQSSNMKWAAINYSSEIMAISKQMEIDINHIESRIRLGHADQMLKDEGFSKITETLRESVILSMPEMKDFFKEQSKVQSYYYKIDKLVRLFEADETNFRKIYEIKSRTGGL